MNEEPEQKYSRDDVYKSLGRLKLIGGIIIAILLPIAGGSVWLYRVDASGVKSESAIVEHGKKISELERWQIKMDAERFTAKEASVLSSRLSSLEQSNAEIYRTLQRIDSKLP